MTRPSDFGCAMDTPLSFRRSINFKLGRLVVIAVGIGLALVAGLGLWQETDRYVEAKRERLLAIANVFAAGSSKALAAGDSNGGMRAMARMPGLAYVTVEDRAGRVVADLGSAVRLEGDLNLDEDA